MKTSKRLLSLLLALTMVLSLMGNLSVAAFADNESQSPVVSTSETEETSPADTKNSTSEGDLNASPENDDSVGDPDANPNDNPENGDSEGDKNDVKKDEAPAADEEETPAADEEETPVVAVPTRKADYPAASSATVKTGTAYLLSDLQAGKIFDPAEGKTLTYENYYYERSEDGGVTWGAKTKFENALFGATLIQITETTAGTYTYRFYASHDGKNFSADTWTLTLTVEDNPTMNFTFYVGKDYNGNYPIIKLYNVTTGTDGNETLGDEIENAFLYSNFTSTLPEGEEEYDPANGKLDNSYQMFYAKLTAGRYAYRAFAKNADTGAYDVALGGMTLDLPTDTNVDGGTGGGNSIYLRCNSFYTDSKKADNTFFTAEEYHIRVTCPIMKCDAAMGDPYVKGNYAYYPTMLYAAGNACLYNTYAYPDIDGYIFSQNINQTFSADYSADTKKLTINTGIELTVTVPVDATFGLYFQWNNFNTTEVAPIWGDEEAPYADRWTVSGSTKTATYFISKNNGNYTWRLSDDKHVTQAGWLANQSANAELTFDFAENAATDRVSHDFSNLGTQTSKRDEADLQINLDPSGYKAVSGTTRVRAYRHWQLINSDAGNIMVEPDFHWNTLFGDAAIATVNGGNADANWADITPGTQDSIIAVYYDSVDVNHGNYGSHGGLFPATSPERVGVIVVGGTGVTHGTADADVDFNMAAGVTTTRSMDWDYNYDTWFYEASEKNPSLDFAMKATGDVTVEYAFVTTNSGMTSTLSSFTAVDPGADGRYTVALNAFNTAGTNGGTVIIRMTDSTGVSYRLVRVAKVTITAENVSNPGEDIMPGDQVKLSFKGMYRAVNKVSGIFNPTLFKPTYYAGDAKYEGTLAQYQRMDNATVTVTIPADVTFENGASTMEYTLTNGYTFGSMYSAANPFAFLYTMTDTGVGTNFNAVTVTYYMNHYADAVITVHQKATYTVKLNITDENGQAVDGVAVTVYDKAGNTIEPNEDGTYTLGYGTYNYVGVKEGYVCFNKSFKLGSADAADVVNGKLVKDVTMNKAADNAWDGETTTEPDTDENGIYQISTGAELAWFAQSVNSGNGGISAVLTKDIDLAGFNWTPIGTNKSSAAYFTGSFDGQDHTVDNLYINFKGTTSATPYQGFFGFVYGKSSTDRAVIKNVTVRGDVVLSGGKNTSTANCGGVIGQAYDADLTNIHSEVNVTLSQNNGTWDVIGGVIGNAGRVTITNCSNSGEIRVNRYGAGIVGSASNTTITGCYNNGTIFCPSSGAAGIVANLGSGCTVSNCYNSGTIGSSGTNVGGIVGDCGNATVAGCINVGIVECKQVHGSLIGRVSNASTSISNLYYLEGTCEKGLGSVMNAETQTAEAKTAKELKSMIAAGDHPFKAQMLDDLKIWDGKTTTEPAKDENGVYQIGTAAELAWFAKEVNAGKYTLNAVLTADIDLENNPWTPIANSTVATISGESYKGTFNGNGHVVSNLYIKNNDNKQGLFSYVSGTIMNLGVTGSVTTTGVRAGGIAGYMGGGKVENCYSAVNVTAAQYAGGIAGGGQTTSVKITNCYNAGNVTVTNNYAGGIASCAAVGFSNGPKLDNCYNIGSVSGKSFVGGIASINKASCFGENLYYLDTCVKGTSYGKGNAKTADELLTLLGAAAGDDLQTALFNKWKGQVSSADDEAVKAAIDAIAAIPQPVTLSSKAKIVAAEKLYNALTAAQKAKVTNAQTLLDARTELERLEAEQAAADKAAADAVIDKINDIGEVTLEKETAIKEARSAYDALDRQQQKNLVKNAGALDTLEAAEATLAQLKKEMVAVNATIEWIDRIDDPVTLESEEYLTKLREYYEKLTEAQKKKVTNYAKLVKAEEDLAALKKAAADKAAAKAVDDLIDAIGDVELTDDSKAKIDAARDAYNKLTDDQKKLIDEKVLKTLTDAEAKYKELADQAAADAVIKQINDIGEVELTDGSKAKIDAARKAYDALTEDQKKLIDEDVLKTLTDAEKQYEKLAADKKAADAVIKQINDIGEVELTDDSKDKIDAAREAYKKLTEDQKKLVSDEVLKKLTDAEKQYEKLAADKAAADAVTEKINAIGDVKLDKDSKAKIDAAREAYKKLTEDQKKLVSDEVLKKLTDAEAKYKELKNQSGSGSGSSGGNPYQKNDAKKDDTKKSANTGDDSQLTLWLGGVVLSAAALALLAKKRRQDA